MMMMVMMIILATTLTLVATANFSKAPVFVCVRSIQKLINNNNLKNVMSESTVNLPEILNKQM
jgi:hypothetical protein